MNIGRLRVGFLLVDLGFVAYWIAAWLHLFPSALLFKDYDNPILSAWNLSFMPLDLMVSATGLGALWLQARRRPAWELLAVISLTLTMCSGLQAISFWALRHDFAWVWWAPNLLLVIYPLCFLCPLLFRGEDPAGLGGGRVMQRRACGAGKTAAHRR